MRNQRTNQMSSAANNSFVGLGANDRFSFNSNSRANFLSNNLIHVLLLAVNVLVLIIILGLVVWI